MDARMDAAASINHKRNRLLLVIFALVLVLGLAVTSLLNASNSDKSLNKQSPKNVSLISEDSSTIVEGQNPIVTVTCEKAEFTMALVVDRSGSVYDNRETYKEKVKEFIENVYSKLGNDAKLNVIINAFATRSVNQNDIIPDSDGTLKTSITDSVSLEKMKDVVDEIYFIDGGSFSVGDGYFAKSNDSEDIRKSYNPTADTIKAYGNHGATNWEDATKKIVELRRDAYNQSKPGKRIDLMVMLTDGVPTTGNGTDHIFKPADDIDNFGNSEMVNLGINAARDNVAELRNPTDGTFPTAVRSVLINSNQEYAMKKVFGSNPTDPNVPQNYYTTENFGNSLSQVLDGLITSIETTEECTTTYVYPKIQLIVSPANFSINEGIGNGKLVTITVKNLTIGSKLENVTLSTLGYNSPGMLIQVPGFAPGELQAAGKPGDTYVYQHLFEIPLGGSYQPGFDIYAWGNIPDGPRIKVAPGADPEPKAEGDLAININRSAFPA